LKRFGRIALKTVLWIIGSVIVLLLLIAILIQIPAIQNFAKNKAVTFLENKIHTKVKIGHISLGLPKMIVLDSVYFEDQKKDTLIAGDQLKVNISMLKLLHHTVEINEIDLKGITLNVHRDKDSVFNFDYIVKAFASKQKTPVKPQDTASAMKFSVGTIILDRIHIAYNDATNGNNVKFNLGHFDTRIKDFDMDKMKFTIPKITLEGFDIKIVQTTVGSSIAQAAAVDTATTPINMTLKLGTIDLSKIKVDYQGSEMKAFVNLGKFLVEVNKIDLKNHAVDVGNLTLSDTRAALAFAKPQTVKTAVVKAVKKMDTLVAKPQSSKGWAAVLRILKFNNDDIKFDNDAQKPIGKGLDYAHMNIRNLNADIENLAYNTDTISGKINDLAFSEKSGLDIQKFHTAFFYGPRKSYLNDLYLETPHTILQKQVEVGYPSLANISKDLGQIRIKADLDGSKLGLKDVLLMMPAMASMEPFKSHPNAVFLVNGRVIGKVNDLSVPSLEVSGLRDTHIKMSGNLKGLPDMNKAYFDLNIADLNTSRTDVYQLVAADMIPTSVAVPENLNLKGSFKGTMKNFNTKLMLRSSDGAVDVSGVMNMSRKGNETYSANIKTKNLNIGALTKQPQTVGTVTLTASIKGRGIDPKKLNLQFNGNVASAYVKGYTYKNLVMKGTAVDGNYSTSATMRDPNISFALNGKANMNKKYPSVNATVMVDSMNLKNLHLSKEDARFHGKLVANVPTADPDYLNADIKATDLIYVGGGRNIRLDTVSLVSTANSDSSTIRLKTQMLSAYMSGKYKLTQVGDAVQDLIDKYYNRSIAKTAVTAKPEYSPQRFTFGVRIVKTPLLTQFVPDLKQLDPVIINGRFDSQTRTLIINGTMPKIVYGAEEVDNMRLVVNTSNSALNYSLSADQIRASSSIDLLYTTISGSARNNQLGISLQVRDASKKERYRVAGVFSVLPSEYQFSFLQNGLMLDYKPWTVSADNALQFGAKGIMAKNFTITNAGQTLSINSTSQQMNAPIDVDFKNFHIETLTRVARQDSLQIGGVINGRAEISNFEKSPVFTSALNIGDFNFKGDTVGNIALKVNNQTQYAYAADVSITGKGNQVNMKGLYNTGPQSRFDLNLDMVRLNMKSIEGFTFGKLKESRGAITGQLKISGTTSAPAIRGDVHFDQVGFNVAMLNSFFTMPKESLTFDDQGIRFNNFTLVDSTGNKAVITGAVLTQNYSDFTLAMNIHTDNFRVINSTQANNRLYYGKLYLNSDISVKGNAGTPRVDANITVDDKTDMTFVLPVDDPGLEDRQGVVEVINPHAPKADSILLAKQLDSLRKSRVNGLDVSATIRINKNARFTVVVDERNGDVVKLSGEARLNGGIDPSGKTNLTGTYTIEQGSYNLSYATVKRKFLFKKGSTITWTGDPTTADVNITATYVANVPPIDLVSDQLGGDVQSNTMYKQKLPFNVNLAMKEQLLKPAISFDIVLPDSTYSVSPEVITTVQARLDQMRLDTNEMNKQVLGVLVLGHFIGDNPLQSQGGNSGVEGLVRNSVSSLLSNQLNKLAGNLIGGVQMSFDLTSGADYSTGVQQNRTDLNVGLSKKFLNDRITVSVGNNFNLEGQNQPGQKTTDIAGNVSVNYMLTKDGRYMIRVYRRDQYIVVEGQVVETGAGFTITYEFNKFKELFAKKSKQEKELQKQYKQEQKDKKQEQKESDKQAGTATTTTEITGPEDAPL